MELIDTTGTGHAGALKYWEPRFLPEELCLGSRNLTVLYRQWGNLAMQDLDAPEKTKVIHAFPGSILAMRLFDGDTKVALNSSNKRFDPEAGRDNNFETRDPSLLKDETKVYDLRTGECIEYYEDWSKWYEVSLRAQDLGDYPVAEAHAREDFHQNQRFFELCRVQGRLLYFSRGEGASDLRHVVVRDADLQEPLCWYTGDDRAPTWINAHCTSDGKYLFIRENTFLPFSLENVFDEELSSVDSSEGADESDHLHTDLAERFCNEQVQPAVDYPIDEQYDNNDNNDNSLYGAIAQLIDIYHQGSNE
jgi:hypothetical protein